MDRKNAFELIRTIDLSNDKKLSRLTQISFLIIAALGVGIICLLEISQDNEMRILFIVLSCVAYIMTHELIHILFMLLFSREKILFHFKPPYLAVGSNYYFSKYQFIIIALAPFVLFSAALIVLFAMCPHGMAFLLSVVMVLNFAGSSGDFIQVFIISRLEKDIYIQDDSKCTKIYRKKPRDEM